MALYTEPVILEKTTLGYKVVPLEITVDFCSEVIGKYSVIPEDTI